MKFNISKEWMLNRIHLEEGVDIDTGIQPPPPALEWSHFPINEMLKRNWFKGFSGTLAQAKSSAQRLIHEHLSVAPQTRIFSLQRQRVKSGCESDPLALLAWQCQILKAAKENIPNSPYKSSTLNNDWFSDLVKLSRFKNGPIRAQAYLRDAGIALIIEPHLKSTYLDGAAILSDHGPVIGMTLRYNRVDNFWFVLLHELIHVKKHLRKGSIDYILDNLDGAPNDIEKETDRLAGQALISNNNWDTELHKFANNTKVIRAFASTLKISPAIVAGRIRKETNNYKLLNGLIGQNTVRKLFLL